MKQRPAVVAFDTIETVFSLESLRGRLEAAGLPGTTLAAWFAQTLRDAMALDATDIYKPFKEVAAATLATLLAEHGATPDHATTKGMIEGFSELSPQPDAEQAFRRLREGGFRVIALTNGGAEATQTLLRRAGLDALTERVISSEEVRHWKPRREVYLHAAQAVGVTPDRLALVAAHGWDIHGAGRAGLTTGFVARGKPFPATMMPPDLTGETLADVAEKILELA